MTPRPPDRTAAPTGPDNDLLAQFTRACDRAAGVARGLVSGFDRDLARARDLARDLDLIGDRDPALVHDRDRDRARGLISALELTCGPVRDLDRDLDRVHATARGLDPCPAHHLAHDLAGLGGVARVLARVRGLARDLTEALNRALDCAFDLTRDFDRDRDRGLAGILTRTLARALGLARGCHEELISAVGCARRLMARPQARSLPRPASASRPREQAGVVVTGAAARTAAWAVRVLPAADRPRYSDEFRSELWELAAAGAGRREQFRYAARLLTRAPSLRIELKVSRTRQAVS
ncbi:hypothetical protein [Actinomadura roseirufa]|uniref:hypothetical protein n=1 Tax=Actinomadura roseirufa TaxID=2094049 RepID=UPI001A954953|nr:hypothetical protein [Actinomadura roseirufa]